MFMFIVNYAMALVRVLALVLPVKVLCGTSALRTYVIRWRTPLLKSGIHKKIGVEPKFYPLYVIVSQDVSEDAHILQSYLRVFGPKDKLKLSP